MSPLFYCSVPISTTHTGVYKSKIVHVFTGQKKTVGFTSLAVYNFGLYKNILQVLEIMFFFFFFTLDEFTQFAIVEWKTEDFIVFYTDRRKGYQRTGYKITK